MPPVQLFAPSNCSVSQFMHMGERWVPKCIQFELKAGSLLLLPRSRKGENNIPAQLVKLKWERQRVSVES